MSTIIVHVQNSLLITPSHPTPNHTLQLSALDSQIFLRFTFEYLFVYTPRFDLDKATIINNVKSALGLALVPYYPLAGRVRARPDNSGLEVVCRAQGALFIHAVSHSTVSEFDGPPHWQNFLSLHVADVLDGAPPLVVQLTWLADGGAVLAVGFNHCMCDGVGSGEFLNLFADLALGKPGFSELKPEPIWSRHLLDPVSFGLTWNNSLSHLEFGSVPDLCGFAARYAREKLVPTSITFDKNMLNELKILTESKHTSFEALSAHIWRSWARALNLSYNQMVKLLFSVNIRDRVKPSLPNGYYGNAFVLGCAHTCAGELTEKGLTYAAELVARAKESVGDRYVKEVVELVSRDKATVDSVGVLIMTKWSGLGLESVDFGMGKPVQVAPICCGNYCKLCPIYASAIKVNVAVPLSAVDQYLYLLRNIYA